MFKEKFEFWRPKSIDDLPTEVIEEAKKLLLDVAQYHHTNQELYLGKVTKEWKMSFSGGLYEYAFCCYIRDYCLNVTRLNTITVQSREMHGKLIKVLSADFFREDPLEYLPPLQRAIVRCGHP